MKKKFMIFAIALILPGATWANDDMKKPESDIIIPDQKFDITDIALIDFDKLKDGEKFIVNDTVIKKIDDNSIQYKDDSGSIVTITVEDPKEDISWNGMAEIEGRNISSDAIVLPFLPSVPIENLEVKFKVLKHRF